MPPDDSDACSSVATTPFQVFIQKDQSEDMEKLFLWVLNPEASGEGQAPWSRVMSFLWAQGFGVSESSQAQPSREQNLTIPRYTVEFGEWLRGPDS